MLCNNDSEEVTTKFHLLKVKPSFGDDTSEATTSADSASGDQKPKRVEVKKEGRQSQGRARQSCDGARNAARETNQKRRAFFLTAGHIVTLDPQKMTDFAGTPIEGNLYKNGLQRRACQRRASQIEGTNSLIQHNITFSVENPNC